jgi:hypothetical protein
LKNKPTLWIFSLEPLETRYTKQWHEHLPKLLLAQLGDRFNIIQVDGIQNNSQPTPGAFLNFSDTNYWKSSQLCKFLEHHNRGETSPNDHILFTDFWNPTVIQLRYMSDLLGFNWKLHGMVHAGSYDSADFLGRLVGNKPWVRHSEIAFFEAFDYNYFATKFHVDMFTKVFFNQINDLKIVRTGWPMEYMQAVIEPFSKLKKRDLILFPHRVAPEKQVEIFRDLAEHLPQYEFVVCQDTKLTKDEYHALLGQSKIVFSANLQETLGITTCAEGPLAGAIPLAPDRLSYSEIFSDYPEFLYPSNWTTDWDAYIANRDTIVQRIIDIMENYEQYKDQVDKYLDTTYPTYFNFAGIASDHAE